MNILNRFKSRQKFANSLTQVSGEQAKTFSDYEDGAQLSELVPASYGAIEAALGDASAMDPRTNASAQAIYGINAESVATSRPVVFSTIAMNAMSQASGPGVLTIGGCDYHDGTQTTGDAKDLEIGIEIGRAVELAHRLGQPLFFHVLTDGGVYSVNGTRKWQGDSGTRGMSIMGYFNPKQAPEYVGPAKIQLGYYSQGQGAETNTLLGNSPALVGYAVFANYLSVCGRLGEFHNFAPEVFLPKGQLESVVVFAEVAQHSL